jgi:hypothetical protein
MFCGISTALFDSFVPSISALLSAAEMLQSRFPRIRGAFIRYAAGLIENHLVDIRNTAQFDAAFAPLRTMAQSATVAPVDELERFGNSLLAAGDPSTANEFYRLAYLAYCATSIHGPIPPRIGQKIAKLAPMLAGNTGGILSSHAAGFQPGAALPNTQPDYPTDVGDAPDYPEFGDSFVVPSGFPPQGNTQAGLPGGPPQFTPGGAGQPQFTPGGGGSPQFTPGGGGPPQFTPSGYGGGGAAQPKLSMKQLAEMSLAALKAGADEIALSAIMAMLSEFQKSS